MFHKALHIKRFFALTLLAAAGLGACGCDGGGGGTVEAAVVKPNAPTLPYTGKVLILPGGSGTAHLVLDLSTAQSVDLPQSWYDLNGTERDGWGSAFDGQELIRKDYVGNVSLFAWPSLQELARFRPKVSVVSPFGSRSAGPRALRARPCLVHLPQTRRGRLPLLT